jgi:hypothetical protein
VPEYEASFMELLSYPPHLNTEKFKVNKFLFCLKSNIHSKVRILMSLTLHDAVHKAFIAEEELNGGGQGRTPSRQTSPGAHQHAAPPRHTTRPRVMPKGPVFATPRRQNPHHKIPYRRSQQDPRRL